MANAAKLAARSVVRALIMGYPGTGKTGSLASLANAGYKLRILDFDGNPESLLQYTEPRFLPNIDIVSLEEKIGKAGAYVGVKGTPTAFYRALDMLDHWRYPDPEGPDEWTPLGAKTPVRGYDLGKSSEWGQDTIVVLDGMTGLTNACMDRARSQMNKTPLNTTQAVWGLAAADQLNFIKALTAESNPHHTIVISHVKMVGPKDTATTDSDLTATIKQQQGDLIHTRLYPTAVGWALPQAIAGEFPISIEIQVAPKPLSPRVMQRRFQVHPKQEMDIKLPVKNIERLTDLGCEDGLLKIFNALGSYGPAQREGAKPAHPVVPALAKAVGE